GPPVNGARHELLAGAAAALDEERRARRGRLHDLLAEPEHGATPARELVRVRRAALLARDEHLGVDPDLGEVGLERGARELLARLRECGFEDRSRAGEVAPLAES